MDVASLTVPQLKARCKELKLTGYSKLSRVALLQKLGHSADITSVSAPTTPNFKEDNPSRVSHDNIRLNQANPLSLTTQEAGPAPLSSLSSSGGPVALQSPTTTSSKRKHDVFLFDSRKNVKLPASPLGARETMAKRKSQNPSPSMSASTSLPGAELPSLIKATHSPKQIGSGSMTRIAITKPVSSRFLPLVPSHAAIIRRLSASQSKNTEASSADKLRYLDSVPENSSTRNLNLPTIGFPPSLKQRDSVQMWAIALRLLTAEDRRQCVLVSRTIRYAVYLSATHIIKHDFGPRRLDVLTQYSQHIHNFWPSLLQLRADMAHKKQLFKASFLSVFFASHDPISGRVWGCVDHDDQLAVAMRYLATRMWFCLCINGGDKETLRRSVVVDAQEIVRGEIWLVIVDNTSRKGKHSRDHFYVLYDTCEVIGNPPASTTGNYVVGGRSDMRSDWSLYAASHIQINNSGGSLLGRVKWNNEEEYFTGMSRHWLSRIKGEGAIGEYKRKVGTRYVLASVVSNSISGTWMTSSHMAQVFAGTVSENDVVTHKPKTQQVNFFLPAHHLVESVHFTSAGGQAFHPAIACVRTPDREYFILKDNGMTIGCEEDGIWDSWTEMLHCDKKGMKV